MMDLEMQWIFCSYSLLFLLFDILIHAHPIDCMYVHNHSNLSMLRRKEEGERARARERERENLRV